MIYHLIKYVLDIHLHPIENDSCQLDYIVIQMLYMSSLHNHTGRYRKLKIWLYFIFYTSTKKIKTYYLLN